LSVFGLGGTHRLVSQAERNFLDRDLPEKLEGGIDLFEPPTLAPSEQILPGRGRAELPIVGNPQQAGTNKPTHGLLDLFAKEDRMVERVTSGNDSCQIAWRLLDGDRRSDPRISELPVGHGSMITHAPSVYQRSQL
jgi:hypothetical protein